MLVVDKPPGMTSHDVVAVVRRRLGTRKVGHAGTLDPDATGILVLGVGRATRLLEYGQSLPKRYIAGARFGIRTTTQDASGEVIEVRDVNVKHVDLDRIAVRLTGDIEQIPPMVSAIKMGGERLYVKARRGEEVERAPRRVTVYSLDVVGFEPPDRCTLDVVCSGGTYVRTLVADMGEELGCGAHMTSLRRIESAGFTEADAVALDAAGEDSLRPPIAAVASLPVVEIEEDQAMLVADGRPLEIDAPEDGPVAVVCDGTLLAVYRRAGDKLVAEKVVAR